MTPKSLDTTIINLAQTLHFGEVAEVQCRDQKEAKKFYLRYRRAIDRNYPTETKPITLKRIGSCLFISALSVTSPDPAPVIRKKEKEEL